MVHFDELFGHKEPLANKQENHIRLKQVNRLYTETRKERKFNGRKSGIESLTE